MSSAITGSIISLNPRKDDGAGIVLDKKAGRTYAFFFHDVEGFEEHGFKRSGLRTGRKVIGKPTIKGTLVHVQLVGAAHDASVAARNRPS